MNEEAPTVTLPSREALKRATNEWWEGTDLQQTLIDICRGARATLEETKQVASKLAERAPKMHFINHERVEEQLAAVRANNAWLKSRGVGQDSDFDPLKCLFGEGLQCPQCSRKGEPVVHGALLRSEEVQHGVFHVQRYVAGAKDHRELMLKPQECPCTEWLA